MLLQCTKGALYSCDICGVHFTEIESRSFKVHWQFGGPAGWLKSYGCKGCSADCVDHYDYDVDNDTQAHSSHFSCESYDSYVSYASYVSNVSYTCHVFILFLTLLKFLR